MSETTEIRHEGMRIGGEIVFTDAVIEVAGATGDAKQSAIACCG